MIFGSMQKILERYMQIINIKKTIKHALHISELTEEILKELHWFVRSRRTDIFYGVKNVESYADRCGALGRN